ncbi:MAG TPA: type II toxin-antitoxin system prevent-host-death family antitoxin [Acidimicrobiia bacterium]
MERIGVRELRQQASRYLARVATGETFEVTDRGRPVAHLVPVPSEPWEIRILPAEEPGDVLDEQPEDFGIDVSAILAQMRRDERY